MYATCHTRSQQQNHMQSPDLAKREHRLKPYSSHTRQVAYMSKFVVIRAKLNRLSHNENHETNLEHS